jgi:uncharacterized protein (TIGR02284 family)
MNQLCIEPDQVISTLNRLIELNRDGQKSFQEAAGKMAAPHLKTYCFKQSRSHAHFVGELQTLVHSLGDEPDNGGTVLGALHRGWMELRSALGGGDQAILAATETFENFASNKFRDALNVYLPTDVRDIVERQFASVKQTIDTIKELRSSLPQ